MTEFKLRFRELRKTLGITLREMSGDLLIPLSSISKYEQGLIKPGVEILSKIARCYRVNLNWLITGEGPMFEVQNELLSLGNNNALRVRCVKYEDKVKIHPLSNELLPEFKNLKKESVVKPDESIAKLAKNINKPVCVEYLDMGNDETIKAFYPDGTVEVLGKNETLKKSAAFNDIRGKIISISDDKNKLNFVNVAIDALANKDSFNQLKTLVQGMEIVFK